MEKALKLIGKLNFEECIELFNKLPNGSVMIDLVFDRMKELDAQRFDKWL